MAEGRATTAVAAQGRKFVGAFLTGRFSGSTSVFCGALLKNLPPKVDGKAFK